MLKLFCAFISCKKFELRYFSAFELSSCMHIACNILRISLYPRGLFALPNDHDFTRRNNVLRKAMTHALELVFIVQDFARSCGLVRVLPFFNYSFIHLYYQVDMEDLTKKICPKYLLYKISQPKRLIQVSPNYQLFAC